MSDLSLCSKGLDPQNISLKLRSCVFSHATVIFLTQLCYIKGIIVRNIGFVQVTLIEKVYSYLLFLKGVQFSYLLFFFFSLSEDWFWNCNLLECYFKNISHSCHCMYIIFIIFYNII
jgi:hypothetical protein